MVLGHAVGAAGRILERFAIPVLEECQDADADFAGRGRAGGPDRGEPGNVSVLKRSGAPVEFVLYAREPHRFQEAKQWRSGM